MPTLRKLQKDFTAHIFCGDDTVLDIVSGGALSPAERMHIYHNNSFLTLTDTLRGIYPVVCRLVDTRFFSYAAQAFIPGHPPTSGNLHDYGAAFPDFLADFAPAQTLPYLPDVARMEWALHAAYHAPDAPPFDVEALLRLPPDAYATLQFSLHPSCRFVESPYPILHIWNAHRDSAREPASITLTEDAARAFFLVQRIDREVQVHPLDQGEYIFLRELQAGKALEQSFKLAASSQPNTDLQQLLIGNVSRATLSGFHPS
ncbi:MAG: putative DNA-binding domain-containing protein [Alphaproteobacteria bacterium]|nr:putative DNA-binding domain-containing protein [Alphaproteobacteria bacterium]